MLKFEIIGNLGADAQVKAENGKEFVSFNVGHNERWSDAQGIAHESTIWVSCALNGNGGNLLPYLKKGRCVYVSGRGAARVYSSEKARGYVAGLNIAVDRVELVGATPDAVPRQLFTSDGVVIPITKAFFFGVEHLKAVRESGNRLLSADGREFIVSDNGYVQPLT